MAFLGVGSCDPYEGMMYKSGYLTLDETKQLIDMNAIGDLCGHRIAPNGDHIKTFLDQRIIAIDLEKLKKIPRKVALAAGRNKAESIIAACRGGYVDVLVTDEIAAMTIQRMLRTED
jgi:DNA-binding transcriptional regulator LsrR (DeoR family)